MFRESDGWAKAAPVGGYPDRERAFGAPRGESMDLEPILRVYAAAGEREPDVA